MAEYKLSYTASEIDERLGMVDKLSNITVDSELSSTSENPIQNKAVNAEFSSVNNNISSLQTEIANLKGGIAEVAELVGGDAY